MGTWDELNRRRPAAGSAAEKAQREAEEKRRQEELEAKANEEMAKLCQAVFSTAQGRQLLRQLRRMTKDRLWKPGMPDSALVHLEGQRQLVHQIETWTAHGLRNEPADFRTDLAED